MIPMNGPQLFPPSICSNCEYFFLLQTPNQSALGCCVIHNTHVPRNMLACPWRVAISSRDNALAWAKFALPWIEASLLSYSGDTRALEIIMLEKIQERNPTYEDTTPRKDLDLQSMPRPIIGKSRT